MLRCKRMPLLFVSCQSLSTLFAAACFCFAFQLVSTTIKFISSSGNKMSKKLRQLAPSGSISVGATFSSNKTMSISLSKYCILRLLPLWNRYFNSHFRLICLLEKCHFHHLPQDHFPSQDVLEFLLS